jgi:hypothetical protein
LFIAPMSLAPRPFTTQRITVTEATDKENEDTLG